ncbi:MAG: hypothetical protein KF734_21695 [Saprospiraceae bacterium]|nr:hypothetical protein [Saprospiraceae bacterium]
MKKQHPLLIACIWLVGTTSAIAQDNDFNNCAAAFLGNHMIVNEYSTEGKCVLAATSTGELTLRPVFLSEGKEPQAGPKIPFKIAIRDGGSKTLMLFSDKTHTEIDIQKILPSCKKDDRIVLLTMERNWAVPHGEIWVE